VLFPACRQAGFVLSFAQAKESAFVMTLTSAGKINTLAHQGILSRKHYRTS